MNSRRSLELSSLDGVAFHDAEVVGQVGHGRDGFAERGEVTHIALLVLRFRTQRFVDGNEIDRHSSMCHLGDGRVNESVAGIIEVLFDELCGDLTEAGVLNKHGA